MPKPSVTLALTITLALASCHDAAKETRLQNAAEKSAAEAASNKKALEQTKAQLNGVQAELAQVKAELAKTTADMTAAIQEATAAKKASPAADFQKKLLPKLRKANGSALDESELTPGGVTLLYFSASWCGPCKQVSPYLEQYIPLFRSLGMTPVLVGQDKNTTDTLAYLAKYLPHFNAIMPEDQGALGLSGFADPRGGIPYMAVIDGSGNVLFKGYPQHFINMLSSMRP